VPLSEDLRNELAAIAPERDCDRLAELSGLAHSAGRVHLLGRGEVAVHFDVAGNAVARRVFGLLRAFGVDAEIRTYRRRAFSGGHRYQVHVEGRPRALEVLTEAGVLGSGLRPAERPPLRVVRRACCRGAYLRGALLGGGSLSGPRSLHLEFRTASREGAEFLAMLAPLTVLDRGRFAIAYAKGADAVIDVLAEAGASNAVLTLDEHAVLAATRAQANRLANADQANLVRASRAAHEQVTAVRKLAAAGVLGDLRPDLRELAELRLEHPSLSLRELALKCRPPLPKASVHRRLRKLQELAENVSFR
jgi:cell division protein WhiA